jgi:hypothetical protein
MKIEKKRRQNSVKFKLNERSFERKIENFEKFAEEQIKKFVKKRGKKLIGVTSSYRWGSLDKTNKKKKPKIFSKEYDTKEQAEAIYRPGNIKELSGNNRYKGEKFSWKIENTGSGKWKVSAFHHLQKGESYYNGYKMPALSNLTAKNIKNTFVADITEKYEYYAYELEYDNDTYKLRDITLNFIYEETTKPRPKNPSKTTSKK